MLSFTEFQASKRFSKNLEKTINYDAGLDYAPEGYVYDQDLYIESLPVEQFHMIIGRSEWISKDLEYLESILYASFYIHECIDDRETRFDHLPQWFEYHFELLSRGCTNEQMHEFARLYMGWFDYDQASLDEWLFEHTETITSQEYQMGNRLLSCFSGYGGNH